VELAEVPETEQERGSEEPGERNLAAKFDGKHARANFWVTQQNLAKQKGGYPGYQFSEKKRPKPVKSPAKPAPAAPQAHDESADSPAPTES
jgi:hypothetical protein